MLTKDFEFEKMDRGWTKITTVNGQPCPAHLENLRVPPAWTDVSVDPDPNARVLAWGLDSVGRRIRLYSANHKELAKSSKFERVRCLLSEWEDIRNDIEKDLNDSWSAYKEEALVAYLIYETGMRPGSDADTLAKVQAYGATTLQLRHVKSGVRGIRLKFIGKKGVKQNVLVVNPYLVRVMAKRKKETTAYTTRLFKTTAARLRDYFLTLGSGIYHPKDFRTARGTALALELLGNVKRLPKTKKRIKQMVNDALDRVAKKLGNTRAVSRSAYVDPTILERFLPTADSAKN